MINNKIKKMKNNLSVVKNILMNMEFKIKKIINKIEIIKVKNT